ncbi:hypothetical protein [Virgibacillus halodenitrificans]|uniref:hypothetical protein n=1 Tax=Virgibacillus halodenitrificans TaxID=1482 RepID=UPI001F45F0CB|nr:hypothetical protein [Virgibacillus halodenitrificans]
MEQKITIPTDSEGYYSLECPYCKEKFKALGGDIDAEDTLELFCPSCGLVDDSDRFIPDDVIEHAQTLAMNYVKQQLTKTFKKASRKMKGSGLTLEFKKLKEEQPNLLTEDEKLEKVEFHCCNKIIKVQADQSIGNIYCPFCGVN